jgi:hypothetical protein
MQTVIDGASTTSRQQVLAVRQRARRWRALAFAAGAHAVLSTSIGIVGQFGRRLRRVAARAWRGVTESEPVWFLRLLHVSRSGDPQATYAATLAWLDRAAHGKGIRPPRLEPAAGRADDALSSTTHP